MYLTMAHINVRSFFVLFFILLSALCAIVFLVRVILIDNAQRQITN